MGTAGAREGRPALIGELFTGHRGLSGTQPSRYEKVSPAAGPRGARLKVGKSQRLEVEPPLSTNSSRASLDIFDIQPNGYLVEVGFHMQTPGRRPFYKYMTPEAAIATLQNRSVRYSSPLRFNDPFDHQTCLHLDFDLDGFPRKLLARIEHLVRTPNIEIRPDSGPVFELINFLRAKLPTHGFPGEAFTREALPILAKGSLEIDRTRRIFESHWQDSLKSNRTFCVTEEHTNLLMWAHYAKDHTGVVLELWSLPEDDNALSVAHPVVYATKPPSFFTEDEFLDYFCGIAEMNLPTLTKRSIYTKSDHWSYEKEWRVYFPLSEEPGLFEDVNLRPSELKAVYFGCRADPSFVAKSCSLLGTHYPDAKKYSSHRRAATFELSFSEI